MLALHGILLQISNYPDFVTRLLWVANSNNLNGSSSEESQFFAQEVWQAQVPAKLPEFFLRADGFGLVEEPILRFQTELGSRISGIAMVEVKLLFKDKLNRDHPNYARDESY